MSLIYLGSDYIHDMPQVLIDPMQDPTILNLSTSQFNMLYSIYSIPNIVIPLLGGVLIDKFGLRTILMVTTSLIAVGQIISWLGA